jgi:arachidonate 15-lipoxygenase
MPEDKLPKKIFFSYCLLIKKRPISYKVCSLYPTIDTNRLGYYDKAFQELYGRKFEEVFANQDRATITGFLRQFQQNLNMNEQEIDANNKKRVVPYSYLKPSLILNSISI